MFCPFCMYMKGVPFSTEGIYERDTFYVKNGVWKFKGLNLETVKWVTVLLLSLYGML